MILLPVNKECPLFERKAFVLAAPQNGCDEIHTHK